MMVQGFGLVSMLIRAFTGERISHIGMLVWLGDGLFVSEFVEFKGYQLLPASLWLQDRLSDGSHIFYGKAPQKVRSNASDISRDAFTWRNKHYGYLSLLKIWWSQITKSKVSTKRVVCSTYIQAMWSRYFKFPKTSDPGDFMDYAEDINRVTT